MRKIVGYTLIVVLGAVAAVLALPIVIAGLLFYTARKLVCWSQQKHVYNSKGFLAGYPISSLTCLRCNRPIDDAGKQEVEKEVNDLYVKLQTTKEALNELLKTPEERAVDEIIEDTK